MYPLMALTDTAVRNAKFKEKPYKLGDSGWLYVIVRSNRSKLWRYKYRLGGKANSRGLGKYPDVSLKEARRRRDECRQDVANGVNPRGRWKATHAGTVDGTADSFETVAREFYQSRLPSWSPGHSSMVLMRLENYVFPKLGTRSIADVSAPNLLAMLRPIQEQEKYETAHRVLTVCGQVFVHAIATGRITHNIAASVRPALTKATPKHFAAITRAEEVGPLLRMLDAYQGTPVVKAALRLAPLVFTRPGELRHAQWADITLDAAKPQWEFLATKTRTPHIVPLAPAAVRILRDLHQETGAGKWVFPGARNNGRPMSENVILAALRSVGIPQGKMTGHGFRAMARTLLLEEHGFLCGVKPLWTA